MLVYAGGIVVLYLFVVMLVKLRSGRPRRTRTAAGSRKLGIGAGRARARRGGGDRRLELARARCRPARPPQARQLAAANVEQVGLVLYTDYLIPFEVASMLLLVAMVGAIVLARRQL